MSAITRIDLPSAWHGAAMARHGRRPSPAPVIRPVGSSPATNQATCFPPALRRLQGEQPQARPAGFSRITNHETRNTAFFRNTAFILFTKHESRLFWPSGRCFPSRCGAAWGGYGAAWAAVVPRAGNTACLVFTSHETRNMFFPCPPATPRRATPSPTNRFSRNTRHETRITAVMPFFPRFPTISHDFPAFPAPPLPPPDQGSARRSPQFPSPSGLVPLRRMQHDSC